jgi:hypothetical protein
LFPPAFVLPHTPAFPELISLSRIIEVSCSKGTGRAPFLGVDAIIPNPAAWTPFAPVTPVIVPCPNIWLADANKIDKVKKREFAEGDIVKENVVR